MMPGLALTNVAAFMGGGGAPPPPVLPTWDPAKKNASVTLSADKLTATAAGSGDLPGLATLAINPGDKVWIEAVALMLGSHMAIGLGNASILLSGNWLGGDLNSLGIYSDGQTWIAGNQGGTLITFAQGDVLNWAVDRQAETIRPYVNNIAQGAAFAHGLTGTLFAAYGVHDANTAMTLRQPTSYVNAPPSGFTKYGA